MFSGSPISGQPVSSLDIGTVVTDLSVLLTETIRVSDSVTASKNLEVSLSEIVHVKDVYVPGDLFVFVQSEVLHVVDGPVLLTPNDLSVSISEIVHITDQVFTHEFEGKLRLSQDPVELLVDDGVAGGINLSQLPDELLVDDGTVPIVRLSQMPIEILVEVVGSCAYGGQVPVVDDPPDGQPFLGRTLNPRLWYTIGFEDRIRGRA